MTPPTIGPAGVGILDCEVGVRVEFEVGCVVVGVCVGVLWLTGALVVFVCVVGTGFVKTRPICPV
jgi:uncharacterized membrane protein